MKELRWVRRQLSWLDHQRLMAPLSPAESELYVELCAAEFRLLDDLSVAA